MIEELPEGVKALVEEGRKNLSHRSNPYRRSENVERLRVLFRKWRNLKGEARFDIPDCLHPYIDWAMPDDWNDYRYPHMIRRHEFVINLPGFAPVAVVYKYLSDWHFSEFLIVVKSTKQRVSSSKYDDLPLFLAIAREMYRPHKQDVKFEEIEGGLADNAKLIKFSQRKSAVLTEADFLNNPHSDLPYP